MSWRLGFPSSLSQGWWLSAILMNCNQEISLNVLYNVYLELLHIVKHFENTAIRYLYYIIAIFIKSISHQIMTCTTTYIIYDYTRCNRSCNNRNNRCCDRLQWWLCQLRLCSSIFFLLFLFYFPPKFAVAPPPRCIPAAKFQDDGEIRSWVWPINNQSVFSSVFMSLTPI